jgi:hypothetical protein
VISRLRAWWRARRRSRRSDAEVAGDIVATMRRRHPQGYSAKSGPDVAAAARRRAAEQEAREAAAAGEPAEVQSLARLGLT